MLQIHLGYTHSATMYSPTLSRGRRITFSTQALSIVGNKLYKAQKELNSSSKRFGNKCKVLGKLEIRAEGEAPVKVEGVGSEAGEKQKVVVVGAGWAGLGAAHHLTKQVAIQDNLLLWTFV